MLQSDTDNSATVLVRDVKAEMVEFMLDHAQDCTEELLLQEFTPEQVEQYSQAASREANRRAKRRLA